MKALDSSREFTSKCIEIIVEELVVVYADSSNATVQKFSCKFVETFPYPAKRANEHAHTHTLGQRRNTATGSASFVNCLFVRSTFFNTLARRVVDARNTVRNTPPIAFATFHTNNVRALHLPSISEYSAIGQHSHVALRCRGAHISTEQRTQQRRENIKKYTKRIHGNLYFYSRAHRREPQNKNNNRFEAKKIIIVVLVYVEVSTTTTLVLLAPSANDKKPRRKSGKNEEYRTRARINKTTRNK